MNKLDQSAAWTICKYSIPLTLEAGLHGDCFSIEMPEKAYILSVATQGKVTPVLWAAVQEDQSLETRHFLLCGTGQAMMKHPSILKFIGTTTYHGSLVLHIFEVTGS